MRHEIAGKHSSANNSAKPLPTSPSLISVLSCPVRFRPRLCRQAQVGGTGWRVAAPTRRRQRHGLRGSRTHGAIPKESTGRRQAAEGRCVWGPVEQRPWVNFSDREQARPGRAAAWPDAGQRRCRGCRQRRRTPAPPAPRKLHRAAVVVARGARGAVLARCSPGSTQAQGHDLRR